MVQVSKFLAKYFCENRESLDLRNTSAIMVLIFIIPHVHYTYMYMYTGVHTCTHLIYYLTMSKIKLFFLFTFLVVVSTVEGGRGT